MKFALFPSIQKELSVTKRGFSLVEVILAAAVFGMLTTALVGAYLYGEESTQLAGNRARAALYAQEGLEALRNIRDTNVGSMSAGVFGLATTSNRWVFAGTSDTNGIFTRQITIGFVGTKRWVATSSVTWQQNGQRAGLVEMTTRLSKWTAVQPTAGNSLVVSTSGAHTNSLDTTQVQGITLQNIDDTNITISTMTLSWSGGSAAARTNDITINGTSVWAGTGTSGQVLDIVDVPLASGAAATPITSITFKKSMTGTLLTLTFTMSDGSSTTTPAIAL
jgi:prepilin-type N-terminal cleavage/methylation domain-containing protein